MKGEEITKFYIVIDGVAASLGPIGSLESLDPSEKFDDSYF